MYTNIKNDISNHTSTLAKMRKEQQVFEKQFRTFNTDDNNKKLQEINTTLANIENLRKLKREITEIEESINIINGSFFTEEGEVKKGIQIISNKLDNLIKKLKEVKPLDTKLNDILTTD